MLWYPELRGGWSASGPGLDSLSAAGSHATGIGASFDRPPRPVTGWRLLPQHPPRLAMRDSNASEPASDPLAGREILGCCCEERASRQTGPEGANTGSARGRCAACLCRARLRRSHGRGHRRCGRLLQGGLLLPLRQQGRHLPGAAGAMDQRADGAPEGLRRSYTGGGRPSGDPGGLPLLRRA